jgi:hypothetical protein
MQIAIRWSRLTPISMHNVAHQGLCRTRLDRYNGVCPGRDQLSVVGTLFSSLHNVMSAQIYKCFLASTVHTLCLAPLLASLAPLPGSVRIRTFTSPILVINIFYILSFRVNVLRLFQPLFFWCCFMTASFISTSFLSELL